MAKILIIVVLVSLTEFPALAGAVENQFAGSAKCGQCHEKEFNKFKTFSKMSQSWAAIKIMASDLSDDELEKCYRCHTTGYGQGGFVSYEKTPHLAEVGCECCHGPGVRHIEEDGNPALIKRLPAVSDCTKCHNPEMIRSRHFKQLIHSGAH